MTQQLRMKGLRWFVPQSRRFQRNRSALGSGVQVYMLMELFVEDSEDAPMTRSSSPSDLNATPQPLLTTASTGTGPRFFHSFLLFKYTFSSFEEGSSE